jgi:hypothetical protein
MDDVKALIVQSQDVFEQKLIPSLKIEKSQKLKIFSQKVVNLYVQILIEAFNC